MTDDSAKGLNLSYSGAFRYHRRCHPLTFR